MEKEGISKENTKAKYVAVVDDENDIVELIIDSLKKDGFESIGFNSGDAFLEHLEKEETIFSIILLDIMLPNIDGMEILKSIRNSNKYSFYKKTPIIMVSAKGAEIDKVVGLELGADDYISKPFSPRELVARVKAVIRRTHDKKEKDEVKTSSIKRIAGIMIDENKYTVYIDNAMINLTTAEFKILSTLISKKGWVFDRNKIIDAIWGEDKYVTDRTVDVHIRHLREKLGAYGYLIKTVRGIGYKLSEDND